MAISEHSTQRLAELCRERLQRLQSIRELSIQQLALAECQNVEPLLSLASQRQYALDALEAIQMELRNYANEDPEQRLWPSQALRQQCRSDIDQGQAILAELLVMEQRSIDALSCQRDRVAGQIQQHHGTQAVLNAYGSQQQLESDLEAEQDRREGQIPTSSIDFEQSVSEIGYGLSLEG